MPDTAVIEELLARGQAIASMKSFGDYMRSTGELDFKFPPVSHHLLLISALTSLIEGDWRRLLIIMPPGGAKSTYCSIQFALWYLAKFPDHHMLCASNTETLAENFNRRRRNACLSKEWQAISGTSLSKDQAGVGKFATLEGGSCTAAGVGTGILGVRSNLNILDDPILNFDQANSMTQMQKHWDWYQSDFRSRLVPTGKELIVTTRFSRADIPGKILDLIKKGEEKDWHVIRIPMEADQVNDPLGRELGERLWPEWFTEDQVNVNKRDTQRWMGMYQQIPMDEAGVWVGPENIEYVDSLPQQLTIVCGVDIALTIGGGDYTVFAVCGIDENRDLFIIDIVRQQVDVDATCETFFALMDMYDITYFYIDDDNSSKMLKLLLIEKCRNRDRIVPLHVMPTKGRDKEVRAATLRGLFMQRRVKILESGKWKNTLVAELMDFPAADHDDQVDALSLIGRQYNSLPIPTNIKRKPPKIDFFLQHDKETGAMKTTVTLDQIIKENDRGGILSIARRRI